MKLLIQTPVRKCIPSPKVESDKATCLPAFVFMEKTKRKPYTIESINAKTTKDCRLTALEFNGYYIEPNGSKHKLILCLCECGTKLNRRIDHLINGRSLSCGCLMRERARKANTKYFPVIEHIYNSWNSMMRRCYNKSYTHYKYYGGRGVIVCKEWHSYQIFLDWSLLNGWREGLEIDKDIKGTGFLYSPENCIWATKSENNETKSNSVRNFGAYKDGKLIHLFKDIAEAMNKIGGARCSYTAALKHGKSLFGYQLKFIKDEKKGN